MDSEIEQLPDREVLLKLASHPAWMRLRFLVYELSKLPTRMCHCDEHRK